MPNTQTGQITLAVIATKLDDVMERLKQQGEQLRAIQSCQDKWDHIPGDVNDLKKTVGDQGDALIALKTRSGLIGGINVIITAIGSTLAGYFGTR